MKKLSLQGRWKWKTRRSFTVNHAGKCSQYDGELDLDPQEEGSRDYLLLGCFLHAKGRPTWIIRKPLILHQIDWMPGQMKITTWNANRNI